MENQFPVNDLLRIQPDWVADPVPPWFFDRFKLGKESLTEMAVLCVENQRGMHQHQIEICNKAIEAIKRAKQ